MHHERITVALNDADGTQLHLQDRGRGLSIDVVESAYGLTIYTNIYGEAGLLAKRNAVFYPWHMVREIHYHGEQ